jgi:hypothetical protein
LQKNCCRNLAIRVCLRHNAARRGARLRRDFSSNLRGGVAMSGKYRQTHVRGLDPETFETKVLIIVCSYDEELAAVAKIQSMGLLPFIAMK